jgi:hypothetical protein
MSEPQPQEPQFVPTAEMKRPHGAFVTQVYASEIGGFCTPLKERLLMLAHLKKTGVLLRYSFEIGKRETEWETRLYEHLTANRKVVKPRLHMPKEQARRELQRLERTYIGREFSKKVDERKSQMADFAYMNDLRAILGMEEWDYATNGVPDVTQELEDAFTELQTIIEPDARMAAVRAIDNLDLLRLIILNDSHASIRELAERRYGELLVSGGKR